MNPKERTLQEIEDLEKDIKSLDDTWHELDVKDDILNDVKRGIGKRKEMLQKNLYFLKRTKVWSVAIQHFNYDKIIECSLKVINNENESRKYNFTSGDVEDAYSDLKDLGLQIFRAKKNLKALGLQTAKLEKKYVYLD